MTMQQFIRTNRVAIDKTIDEQLGNDVITKRNDEERRLWILNHEPLYNLARSERVRI